MVFNKKEKYNVAVVGATGAVGRRMITTLEERNFPVDRLVLLASPRSAGQALPFRGQSVPVEKKYFEVLLEAGAGATLTLAIERYKHSFVSKITDEGVVVTLVNTSQVEARRVVVQAGAYAEHQFQQIERDGQSVPVDGRHFEVLLEAGAGATLTLAIERYKHPFVRQQDYERRSGCDARQY